MLTPIAYKVAKSVALIIYYLLVIALSYGMLGCQILFREIRICFPFRPMESDSESETGSESASDGGTKSPESPRRDLSGNEISLLERENEALQEANRAWFEKVEQMEKEKRHSNRQCSMIAGVGLMLSTVYATIIYVHLLKKGAC